MLPCFLNIIYQMRIFSLQIEAFHVFMSRIYKIYVVLLFFSVSISFTYLNCTLIDNMQIRFSFHKLQ